MAKNVFRAEEVRISSDQVSIEPPVLPSEELEEFEQLPEEYTGPTADDLRREAEAFKEQWEQEKERMKEEARAEADRIVREAEQKAFDEVEKKTNESQKIRQQAEDEAERKIAEARQKAEALVTDAENRVEEIEKEAYGKGYKEGNETGYHEGQQEVERLVEQLHKVISSAVERRNEIIDETETQLISLVLQISQKVIKVISENQKNVVVNNVIQALRKLKTRNDVIVRVNLDDVDIASERIKDFMRMVENVKSITVVEDSSVDKGGCIIETDFGEIDARIASQLNEIQQKVLEMAPIKVRQE
jgi:flagellar assembly protein FliH